MQRKLARLQADHLEAFKGQSLGAAFVPRKSKLERAKEEAAQKAKRMQIRPAQINLVQKNQVLMAPPQTPVDSNINLKTMEDF